MPPKKAGTGKVGRPRLGDDVGTKDQVAHRKYMRQYNEQIAKDIQKLDKLEQDCQEELKEIKKQKKMLEKDYLKSLNMLENANKQAEDILKEATGKPMKKEAEAIMKELAKKPVLVNKPRPIVPPKK